MLSQIFKWSLQLVILRSLTGWKITASVWSILMELLECVNSTFRPHTHTEPILGWRLNLEALSVLSKRAFPKCTTQLNNLCIYYPNNWRNDTIWNRDEGTEILHLFSAHLYYFWCILSFFRMWIIVSCSVILVLWYTYREHIFTINC